MCDFIHIKYKTVLLLTGQWLPSVGVVIAREWRGRGLLGAWPCCFLSQVLENMFNSQSPFLSVWGGAARKEELVHSATVMETVLVLFPAPLTKAFSDSSRAGCPYTRQHPQQRSRSQGMSTEAGESCYGLPWLEVSVSRAPRVEVPSNLI